ncbi:MAG: B12-binding domain-containing radical SAM protein [Patescibacteria group bacterium]|nr:B12-binding domain-containing radical SAM protein [Patescibacteria group bacterium]
MKILMKILVIFSVFLKVNFRGKLSSRRSAGKPAVKVKVLMIYPLFPKANFWSGHWALWFVGKKSAILSLALPMIAALLPATWQVTFWDMNVEPWWKRWMLKRQIKKADLVFLSAMEEQKESALEVIGLCNDTRVVAGGPLFFQAEPNEFPGVDHIFSGEAELTLPEFISAWEKYQALPEKDRKEDVFKSVYSSAKFCDLALLPPPRLELAKIHRYTIVPIELGRGCPHQCTFCSIHAIAGTKLRFKPWEKVKVELDNLRRVFKHGTVFIVNDNLLASPRYLEEFLDHLLPWQIENHFPFDFIFQSDIRMADHERLMKKMAACRFKKVFIGIESINDASLESCHKTQNVGRDLVADVKKIMKHGLEVMAGIIVGLDGDTPAIFKVLYEFLQKSGIIVAMVNVVLILRHTEDWIRMKAEGRLVDKPLEGILNYKPICMDPKELVDGFLWLQKQLFLPRNYFARVRNAIKNLEPTPARRPSLSELKAFAHSLWRIGIFSRYNWRYIRLLLTTFFAKFGLFASGVTWTIMLTHYRKVVALQRKAVTIARRRYA